MGRDAAGRTIASRCRKFLPKRLAEAFLSTRCDAARTSTSVVPVTTRPPFRNSRSFPSEDRGCELDDGIQKAAVSLESLICSPIAMMFEGECGRGQNRSCGYPASRTGQACRLSHRSESSLWKNCEDFRLRGGDHIQKGMPSWHRLYKIRTRSVIEFLAQLPARSGRLRQRLWNNQATGWAAASFGKKNGAMIRPAKILAQSVFAADDFPVPFSRPRHLILRLSRVVAIVSE